MAHKRATVAGFLTLGANKSPLASITHGVDQIRLGNKKGALARALKSSFLCEAVLCVTLCPLWWKVLEPHTIQKRS
jgi:hypothetical protein